MNFVLSEATTISLTLLCSLLPFFTFGIILLFTRNRHRLSAIFSIAAISISFASAGLLAWGRWHASVPLKAQISWAVSGSLTIPVGILLDPTSLLMLLVVTLICFIVQIYSMGYMAGDPGFGRYYGFMSLFAWAMISLTIAPNLLQLYVFWEIVGLASYLLIGFWYEKFSATQAGKKAFVMTRTGDTAFFLGLLLILSYIGNLDILTLNQIKIGGAMSSELLTLSVLLIFGGIAGKSAQFPLLTWLPDAMEGPTPVSALLHSATMVAAGVYLFGRLFPFFSLSPTAMGICLLIGTLSMLLASTMAMVSRDIKQVWAFSTISQLGFMIMGLAAGNLFAGLFHLTTHAGFKALLFLCSGVFIHHFNTNDIQELGEKGGRRLIIPMLCMTLGAAALSGLPPLSGFYSKEVILMALAELGNPVWLLAGLLGVFLTSYYTFRLIFLILCPADNSTVQGEKNHHDHKHDRIMVLPLIILTVITIGLGGCENALSHFLLSLELHDNLLHTDTHLAYLPYSALGLAIFGVLLSFIEFGRPKARQIGFIEKYPRLAELFAQRWYLDNFYRFLVNQVIDRGISAGCSQTDQKIIDGGIDGLAGGTIVTGRILSELQSCIFQYRLMVIFVVMIITALYFLF